MRDIRLEPVTGDPLVTARSRETFTVESGGYGRVRNPESNHRITRYIDGSLIVAAVPTIVALHAAGGEVTRHGGVLTHGERVRVDGVEYVVTPRDLADAALIRP